MSGRFKLVSDYKPFGDQPKAIEQLCKGLEEGVPSQVLLGITGSGKTFTMANIVERIQRPTLVIAHNKTLAAQLYQEFKNFFPTNAVEYFVSYYDYYQPEAYIARTDTYIEKDMAINDKIDKMRLSATRSLLERDDVLIVASVSCIYGLGVPEYYRGMNLKLQVGEKRRRDDLLLHLVEMQYKRNDMDFYRGTFRVRGEVIEIFPAYEDELAIRVECFGEEIERVSEIDPLTGKVLRRVESATIYPSSHHVTPEGVREEATRTIEAEMKERIAYFQEHNKLIEAQRIGERTRHDLEMIREIGFCKGIENYSRHFSRRQPGGPPPCLLDYFPKDYLLFIDESHQTIPQMRAMYAGDRSRKSSLVEFGFRLPSAFDNRPLKFEESLQHFPRTVFVSATPSEWELQEAQGHVVEQIVRPTGLLDPVIEVRPVATQVDDAMAEIRLTAARGGRVLVTTLTKRLAEELTEYLEELGVKAKYLHSDIDTVERIQIIRDLRVGLFDVLVGINLLREGLDIPEVELVLILDADKEGFLRSETSLVQTCGRASRNVAGRVIMYADKQTEAIRHTLAITEKRRKIQEEYNRVHHIEPQTVKRGISLLVEEFLDEPPKEISKPHMTLEELQKTIAATAKEMRQAAKDLNFEEAARLRDLMRHYQQLELSL